MSEYFSQRFRLVGCSYLSRTLWKRGLCLFPKNPAQHFENEEAVRPAFVNCTTGDHKNIVLKNVFELTAVQMKTLCKKKCNIGGRDVTLTQNF